MSDETEEFDHFEATLADLRAKREQIDQAIQALEALRLSFGTPSGRPRGPEAFPSEGPGAYLGMTIPEAAMKLLAAQRRAMGNVEIAKLLKEGGLAMQSVDPVNTIGAVLSRRAQDKGDIVKVGRGTWGLRVWYPNRNFAKKPPKGDEAAEEEGADTRTVAPTGTE